MAEGKRARLGLAGAMSRVALVSLALGATALTTTAPAVGSARHSAQAARHSAHVRHVCRHKACARGPSIKVRHRHAAHAREGIGSLNPYAGGGCTAWAWANRPDLPRHLGDAKYWAANARAAGFPVDGSPEVGAIVVYQPHQYGAFAPWGHVAVVEAVHGDRILISEASYPYDSIIYHRTTGIVGVQFIHHKGYTGPNTPPRSTVPGQPAPPAWPHRVYHTCANGACGLHLHSSPTLGSPVTGARNDGDEVDIVCQTFGDSVSGSDGSSSSVWDKLTDGSFAADYYVDTPGMNGSFSPPIPRCEGISSPTTTTPPPTTTTPAPNQPGSPSSPTAPNRQAITSYNRIQPGAPHHGYFEVAWQPFTAQSNTITTLGVTVGTPSLTAGASVPYNITVRLCTTTNCSSTLAETHPQIVNYGDSQADIGDIAVTPGATYYVVWYQPPAANGNTWVTYWWAGGASISQSDQMQMLVEGYNR